MQAEMTLTRLWGGGEEKFGTIENDRGETAMWSGGTTPSPRLGSLCLHDPLVLRG